MSRWPVVGAAAAVVLVGVLVLGDRGEPSRPTPEPDVTTSTTLTRSSPQLRWAVGPDPARCRARAAFDLDRQRTVVRLETLPGTDDGCGLIDTRLAEGQVGTTVRFSASLQVIGDARSVVYLRAMSRTMQARGVPADVASAVTPDDEAVAAGGWERRSVQLVIPPGTTDLGFGVSLIGPGAVLVDDVVDP
ncbi:MAG: hypothetical protein JWO68_545 [Actinomycetia bacterium]|nr:hypothetical protein [Actinomycetes bacterium]